MSQTRTEASFWFRCSLLSLLLFLFALRRAPQRHNNTVRMPCTYRRSVEDVVKSTRGMKSKKRGATVAPGKFENFQEGRNGAVRSSPVCARIISVEFNDHWYALVLCLFTL